MLKQYIFKVATPVVAALSILCTPISASASWNQSCCPPQDCCQQEEPCCNKGGRSAIWGLVGAAAVGAAAGAITAAAMDNSGKGHRGRRGPAGPTGLTGAIGATGATGASPFAVVTDESLVFNFRLTLGLVLLPTDVILTFVQKPDGTVIIGPSFSPTNLSLQSGIVTISSTEDGPVQIGTYHWGYVFPSSLLSLGITLDDFITEVGAGVNVYPDNVGPMVLQLLNEGETQLTHSFSFDVD